VRSRPRRGCRGIRCWDLHLAAAQIFHRLRARLVQLLVEHGDVASSKQELGHASAVVRERVSASCSYRRAREHLVEQQSEIARPG
jgi:hypothetical protein